MKNSGSRLLSTAIAIASFVSVSLAQFEGSIEFKKMTTTDTTKYIYYIKENKVRIDEIGSKSKQITGTFLVDLDASTMQALNTDRKLYMDKRPGTPETLIGTPEITKTKETKTLLGTNCKEFVVANKAENTTIKYYVGGSKFDFFRKFLKFMNRKDKSSEYFLLLKDAGDGFPYLSIQTDNTGKETGRLEVVKMEKKVIDPVMFEIPKEYKKFEMN